MHSNVPNSTVAELDLGVNDLGPLAWVLDELRKSLEGAAKALKRFVRDAELARGSDLAALDANQLRLARQQLHQAVGALEMVGLPGPALVLRAMEAAVQKFIQRPEQCSQEAAAKIEAASFALTEYLEGVLADKSVSAVSLFPQYRDVQQLVGAERIHPADLWIFEWRWLDAEVTLPTVAQGYEDAARSSLDQSVLQIMRGQAPQAAQSLKSLCLGLAAGQTGRQARVFWKISAAYFEALAHGLIGSDIYVKRAASRILQQFASLRKGDTELSDRLAHDLVFFCLQAVPLRAGETPVLSAIRAAYGLARFKPVNYDLVQFGRFDPALLAQARKRIALAKETWSSLAAGDANKFKVVADQFSLVSDSLIKLHPPSEPLAQALTRVVEATVRSLQAPPIELAMEVATSVLYLEAAFENLDPNDPQLQSRTAHLARRLESVRTGSEPQPVEPWMEELYRRVSDKQTMGTVVGELRLSLGALEKLLDVFFRNPHDPSVLRDVPGQLGQMRGVLSVLGLEQASRAVLRMRESVEQLLVTQIDAQEAAQVAVFEQLGNNLGALSFLIDMLSYQPALAKKLFVYDDEKGELRPLMGRTHSAAGDTAPPTVDAVSQPEQPAFVLEQVEGLVAAEQPVKLELLTLQAAVPVVQAVAAPVLEKAAAVVSGQDSETFATALHRPAAPIEPASFASHDHAADDEDDDLQEIFLEEAREVIGNALQAIEALASDPLDIGEMTILRRAFHTLKGSARMVGLNEFGEAAWSMEQVLNSWLADQQPAHDEFRSLMVQTMNGFSSWVADIVAKQDGAWTVAAFRSSADLMRTEGRLRPLELPEPWASQPVVLLTPATEALDHAPAIFEDVQSARTAEAAELDFELDELLATNDSLTFVTQTELPAGSAALEIEGIDFESLTTLVSSGSLAPEIVELSVKDPAELLDFELELSTLPGETAVDFSAADFESEFSGASGVKDLVSTEALTSAELGFETPEFLVAAEESATLEALAALNMPLASDAMEFELEAGMDAGSDREGEEQIKVIGSLRIDIPLYNVYLNEADEWSRRLVTEVAEWALERQSPVPDSTVALAHSLTGSSATVGFTALSEIARALEQALERSQTHHSRNAPGLGKLFADAAEDIRRLLHQFAAGFMKEPNARILEQLRQIDFVELNNASVGNIRALKSLKPGPETTPMAQIASSTGDEVLAPAVQRGPPSLGTVAPEATGSGATVLRPAVAASGTVAAFDEDDEIDATDAIDPDLFQIFDEEGAELMPRLSGALRQWLARPDNRSAQMEVLRALHTLKGSARLVGALRLGEMAHRAESVIEYMGSEGIEAWQIEPLLQRFDAMQAVFEALRDAGALAEPAPLAPAVALPLRKAAGQAHVDSADTLAIAAAAPVQGMVPAPPILAMQTLRQAAGGSIRVSSRLLDRMINQAGEVMITRSRLEAELGQLRGSLKDMSSNLNRLREHLRDVEVQAEGQMQSRLAQAKEAQLGFDPLEFDRFTRVQELTRMMAESVNDVATVQRTLQQTVEATEDDLIAQARQTRELQRDLLRTRMVEFEGISERLYRVVRLASKETGKQVRLDLAGGTIEMDRGMLDRLTPAFEHLLRNCVAHGIEAPDLRIAAGKDPVGLISVSLRQEGNDVSVDFSDDGAGLNVERIREKALSRGLLAADQPFGDQDAANMILMPGFTTASQVTELAGRGIGLDVVGSEIKALGGRIETLTVSGKGASFRLVLPLTTAVTHVVMLRADKLSIGVAANLVETVRRASIKEIQQAYNSGTLDVAGEAVPFFWSGALLQASHRSCEQPPKTIPVVIFRSAAQRIALHVDEVLGNREVVIKNLGPQLSRLPGLTGMSVLASGAVVLLYNPVALAAVYGPQAKAWSTDSAEPHMLEASGGAAKVAPLMPLTPQFPLVLVVDDSITVRRVTQRLLQREGYRVALAADGLQALERLKEELPAVVLSDIEMPRMDGFDLARNIRGDARLSKLPIIMITSRIAEKHRDYAKELGVNHYLGKPYPEEELMSLIRHYCAVEVPA